MIFRFYNVALLFLLMLLFTTSDIVAKKKNKKAELKYISGSYYDWSGGVAYRAGTKYRILLQTNKKKNIAVPDTIWIGEECVPLKITEQQFGWEFNCKKITEDNIIQYDILIDIDRSNNPYDIFNHDGTVKTKIILPKPPIRYEGKALVSYKINGKRKYLAIQEIEQKETQNYP
jgi:hypothetical protein